MFASKWHRKDQSKSSDYKRNGRKHTFNEKAKPSSMGQSSVKYLAHEHEDLHGDLSSNPQHCVKDEYFSADQ